MEKNSKSKEESQKRKRNKTAYLGKPKINVDQD